MTPLVALPPALLFLAAALVVAAVPRRVGHAVAFAVAALGAAWVLAVPDGAHLPATVFGFEAVLFRVDATSRVVGFALAFVAAADVLYAFGTGATRRQTALAVAYVGTSLGAVFAGDWLTLVVWWELMAATATLLVWRSPAAVRAGYRYAAYHQVGGLLLLAGVLLQFVATGTFLHGGGVVAGLPRALATLGVAVNVGVLGLHVWIVDTYPRPHVATSVVLCAFTTKVGVYTLLRVVPDGSALLAYAGAAMLLVGVTMAVLQTDLRRLLSYHIVSQVGYMVAGVGLASTLAVDGALAHLANNVLYKTLLFMVAGSVLLGAGTEDLHDLGGLGREMPATAAAYAVAAFAIAGVPGFSGFVSKGMVVDAAAGSQPLWWALLAGGVGTVVSFAKVGYYTFLRDGDRDGDGDEGGDEGRDGARANLAQVGAFALLTVPCVAFGLAPGLLLGLLPADGAGASVFSPSQFQKAGTTLAVGLVAFVLLRKRFARVPPVPDLDAVYHPLGARLRDGTAAVVGDGAGTLDAWGRAVVRRTDRWLSGPDLLAASSLGRDTIGRGILLVVLTAAVALALVLA